MSISNSTVHFLLGRFLDTEYSDKFLSKISAENFSRLKEDMLVRFDGELTEEDIKQAWYEWFDWAASNGTLISPHFEIVDADVCWRHEELRVADFLLEMARTAINKL